ncbi:hydrophobe/amphiphile efflux-3 (HAE3) family transporter [Clostridium algidicarnis]|uniref:hydrophobe/amphiphile efflux-3 (HAE3) family transporter n=1 Tax=Clostridium algidicarnis TaxID=37659 RepID=UPI001CF4BB33|nr:hydrophobe/amphiphile efflux-3 (HAE3) family transporter [Clostridium algidicarnis]MCB2287124.1 hydrophobe/amphiphile efflux-3 (HAE3) family transporter [Clostridium algidicarnis]
MNKLFKWIGNLIEKWSVKTLLVTIALFAILIAGVSNVRMATGNDTLVKNDNEVYISNKQMENSFGGDAILVLFTDHAKGNLLSYENLQKMWDVEQRFKYEEDIFSFMSPASIVHQMTQRQSIEIKNQVLTLSDGLDEMSSKMIDLGNELNSKDIKDPKEIEEKLNGLSDSTEAFNKLIAGQDNLTEGAKQIQGGLFTAADGLGIASNQLKELSELTGENVTLKVKLMAISENISASSKGIRTMGEKTTNVQGGTKNTSKALTNVSDKLTKETSSMKEGLTGGISPVELKEMAEGFVVMGEKLGDVSKGLKIFHTKSNMMIADIPGDQSQLDSILYDENNKIRLMFSDVVIDDESSLMVVKLKGNLGDEYKDQVVKDLTTVLENEGFKNLSYVVSGKPVLDSSLRTEMKSNMKVMVVLAVLIMFIVLALVFKVKWRILSLGIILVSVITTLGFMGILSVPITMVSMAVFPILIGLGIDYSIQFHNRYEEEKSVKRTMNQMGKPVAVAVFATVLGFISLYASPVPMIQEFGKMLTIGVIISFLGSIFLLMPILNLRQKINKKYEINTESSKKEIVEKETLLDSILKNSTKIVIRFSIPILIIVIALSFTGFLVDKNVGVETDIETFMPQNMEALRDIHSIRDKVGSTDQMAIYIKDSNILTEENIGWIQEKTKNIEDKYGDIVVGVKSIDTLVNNISSENNLSYENYINIVDTLPKQQVSMFINDDKTESVILLNIKHLSTERLQDFTKQLKDDSSDTTMQIQITGKSVLDVEMVNGLTAGRVKMTIIGLVLVFLSLLLTYKNLIKALIPIIPVALIIGMSSGLMYLIGIKYTPITATLGALVLGMGTEMTVMLLERYMEERKSGKDKLESMITTVTMIGNAIVASGLTTVGGFSVLMASRFIILRDFGLMTVINITLALLSTFIVLPPIIMLLDRFILNKEEMKNV